MRNKYEPVEKEIALEKGIKIINSCENLNHFHVACFYIEQYRKIYKDNTGCSRLLFFLKNKEKRRG